MTLTRTAHVHWHVFDGWCASCGVDALDLPVDRALNLVYYWIVSHTTAEQRAELDRVMADGDTGTWSADAEMDAFARAQGMTAGM